jgi:hypothetical protein
MRIIIIKLPNQAIASTLLYAELQDDPSVTLAYMPAVKTPEPKFRK